jgi:hypothetical protein
VSSRYNCPFCVEIDESTGKKDRLQQDVKILGLEKQGQRATRNLFQMGFVEIRSDKSIRKASDRGLITAGLLKRA